MLYSCLMDGDYLDTEAFLRGAPPPRGGHAPLPVLLTVTGDAGEPRGSAARRMMRHKNARTLAEIEQSVKAANPTADEAAIKNLAKKEADALAQRGLLIPQWDLTALNADLNWCGRSGSPTKVHRIQSVVLAAKESKDIAPTEEGVAGMIHELIQDKIIA
jgi:electron transfer flavoprotein beta subunit